MNIQLLILFFLLIFLPLRAESKILIDANKMRFKKNSNEVEAIGDVEAKYENKILRSEYLFYNENSGEVEADGSIDIVDKDGYKILADHLWGVVDFSKFEGQNVYAMLDGVNHLQSRSISYEVGDGYRAKGARFTSCAICNELGSKTPIWSFSAREVFYDEGKENVYYRSAFFNIMGLPIMYFPYFSHPSPIVKKRTGFLTPSFETSTNLGNKISIPVFVNLASNYDFTYTPMFIKEANLHHNLSARAIGENSKLVFEVGYIRESDDLQESLQNRGLTADDKDNWILAGRYEYNDFYGMQLEYNLKRTSSEAYLQRYVEDFSAFEDSDLLLYKSKEKSSLFAEVDYGNDIRTNNSTYYRLPHVNYRLDHKLFSNESHFYFDTDYLIQNNDDRRQRISFAEEIVKDFGFAERGNLESRFLLRSDFYNPVEETDSDLSESRLVANYYLEYTNDFYRESKVGNEILTPKVKLSLIPRNYNEAGINSYDSVSPTLTYANIYRNNLHSGYDYIDQDSRLSYGVNYQIVNRDYYHVTSFLGQVYRLSNDDSFSSSSGLSDRESDYISSLDVNFFRNYRIVYNTSYDREDYSPYLNELTASADMKKLNALVSYTNYNLSHKGANLSDTEFVSASMTYKILSNVKTSAKTLFDFENEDVHKSGMQMLSWDVTIRTSCVDYNFGIEKTYIDNEYVDPDLNIQFKIVLLGIGQSLF